jgi:branched-subunit amino acid aminotransferase/4-amino-4-deoxychorismate lyase
MLEGITRKIILRLVGDLAVPLLLEAPNLSNLPELDEAFLSSSSRGIVPVVGIAGQRIGDGRPGPVTRRLQEAYESYVAQALQTALASI